MRFTLISARKDLTRLGRDPLALLTALGIPLVLVALITLVFGGRGATPQGKLLIADEDETFVSRTIRSAFGNEPVSKMIAVESVEREGGLRRMDRGEASALLIVPKGFQTAYLRNQPVQLQLVENPAQRILPNIIEETLSIVVDGGFYLQKLAPVPLSGFAGAPPPLSDEGAAFLGIRFNRLARGLRKYLNPPLIDLKFNVASENSRDRNVAALFLPAMLFMSLLFLGNAHALDIWKEQAWGTLRRLASTPVSLAALLGGRLISLAVVLSGVALVGVAGMRWFAGVPVASVAFSAAWLVLSGAAFYLLLVSIAVRASNQRTANVTGNLVVFPLALIGGSFFPFEMMPDWMSSIGRLTPNGWAITQFKALVAGSGSTKDFFVGAAYIGMVGAILFFLALRGIRKLA